MATAFPPALGDFGDDFVRGAFAGGVIDDHRRAFGRELFGDGGADAFGGAGDDGDFAGEFFCAHRFGLQFWFQDLMNAGRSSLIVPALVVGMPCGKPWQVFSALTRL